MKDYNKWNLMSKNGKIYRLSVVIPEGSMLGPLFSLVHITDICNVCDKFNLKKLVNLQIKCGHSRRFNVRFSVLSTYY